MKYLKIVDCSDPLMWYSKKIGKCVPLLQQYEDYYMSREDAGFANIVKLKDAIVVECCNENCDQGRNCPLRM